LPSKITFTLSVLNWEYSDTIIKYPTSQPHSWNQIINRSKIVQPSQRKCASTKSGQVWLATAVAQLNALKKYEGVYTTNVFKNKFSTQLGIERRTRTFFLA
jgi:hypothetical protein